MKHLLLFIFLLIGNLSIGQSIALDVKKLNPAEPYTNVSTIKLHSDENTSVFLIFIKQGVKKHVHQYHTEVITVLDGKGRMYLGGDYFDIAKGDYIVVPPNTPHAVVTTSKKTLKVMSIQAPEFLGNDFIMLEEETPEEATKESNKKPKKDDDIPEFESE